MPPLFYISHSTHMPATHDKVISAPPTHPQSHFFSANHTIYSQHLILNPTTVSSSQNKFPSPLPNLQNRCVSPVALVEALIIRANPSNHYLFKPLPALRDIFSRLVFGLTCALALLVGCCGHVQTHL